MTRAKELTPVRRVVDGSSYGELVVEVYARTVRIRPLGARAQSAAVELPWGALYTRGIIAQDDARRAARRRKP